MPSSLFRKRLKKESIKMSKDYLRDGWVKNWFYLENDLLDREDLTIYEKTVYIVIAR